MAKEIDYCKESALTIQAVVNQIDKTPHSLMRQRIDLFEQLKDLVSQEVRFAADRAEWTEELEIFIDEGVTNIE